MLKIIFKNKNYYFDAFLNEKYFKKQSLPHYQTHMKHGQMRISIYQQSNGIQVIGGASKYGLNYIF